MHMQYFNFDGLHTCTYFPTSTSTKCRELQKSIYVYMYI